MAEILDSSDGRWIISGVPSDQARSYLSRLAPWRTEIIFSGGPKSSDFETYKPFSQTPLLKLKKVLQYIDLSKNPEVLDIGFNSGYNSLFMASKFGASVTGIDVDPKHKQVADELANILGLEAEFLMANAEEFERPKSYDLVLHFGTLYHLPNPLRSIQKAASSLRSGGWFALETVRYLGDPTLAKWVWGFNGDKTNFWALGDQQVSDFFAICGLSQPRMVFNANLAVYQGEMSRAIWIANKV